MKKWKLVIPIAAVAAFIAWYAFRPERLVVNRRVDEAMPAAQGSSLPQRLVSGQFYSILHPTAGTATIYRVGDGSRILRFTGFSTSNGPDVHVYMVAADDAKDSASVLRAGFIDLGTIKGNLGDQNYTLNPEVDLSKYRAGFSVVQTLQRQFWRCSIDARSSGVGEVAHRKDLWPVRKEKSHEVYGIRLISPVN
jgi:hypothetical protein